MKRILCLMLACAMLLSICSCGDSASSEDPSGQVSAGTPAPEVTDSAPEATDSAPEATNSAPEATDGVQPSETTKLDGLDEIDAIGDFEVDTGLFDVTLTIPPDFVGQDETQEQLDQTAKDNGYKSATLNPDGSVTYVMSKKQHKEMMEGIRQNIEEGLSQMVGTEEMPAIVDVKANDDFTQYKVTLNTSEVGLSESFAALSLYMYSGMYHIFNGTEAGNINVQFINEATGEIIDEANSSDMG